MDRLYAVTISTVLLCAACDDKPKASAPTPSRVNAVVAKKQVAEAPSDFCDVYAVGADAVPFKYPELAQPAPTEAKGWRWINVWATWCKPCIEEMPRLATWEKELAADGLGDVVFVSNDDSDEIVAKFKAEHPDAPNSVRITSVDALQPWLSELGLTSDPSLPVHVFVDPTGATRCIRMGGVSDNDKPAVERLLRGE